MACRSLLLVILLLGCTQLCASRGIGDLIHSFLNPSRDPSAPQQPQQPQQPQPTPQPTPGPRPEQPQQPGTVPPTGPGTPPTQPGAAAACKQPNEIAAALKAAVEGGCLGPSAKVVASFIGGAIEALSSPPYTQLGPKEKQALDAETATLSFGGGATTIRTSTSLTLADSLDQEACKAANSNLLSIVTGIVTGKCPLAFPSGVSSVLQTSIGALTNPQQVQLASAAISGHGNELKLAAARPSSSSMLATRPSTEPTDPTGQTAPTDQTGPAAGPPGAFGAGSAVFVEMLAISNKRRNPQSWAKAVCPAGNDANKVMTKVIAHTNGCSVPGGWAPYINTFYDACQVHDICYGIGAIHRLTRAACDNNFWTNMYAQCDCGYSRYYWDMVARGWCYIAAKAFYEGVNRGGKSYYSPQGHKDATTWNKDPCATGMMRHFLPHCQVK